MPLKKDTDAPATAVDPKTLTVELTYQACNPETCLLPKTDRVTCTIGENGGPGTKK